MLIRGRITRYVIIRSIIVALSLISYLPAALTVLLFGSLVFRGGVTGVLSPDYSHVSYTSHMYAGPTSEASTRVFLRISPAILNMGRRSNILSLRRGPRVQDIQWVSNRELVIHYACLGLGASTRRWHGIAIEYHQISTLPDDDARMVTC
jgi:hypothetical protein